MVLLGFAQTIASQNQEEEAEWTMLKLVVKYAKYRLLKISTQNKSLAHVVALENLERAEDVYDLTIEKDHEYFANGLLVHNCLDAFRYILNLANFSTIEDARPLDFSQKYKIGTPKQDRQREQQEAGYGDIDDYILNG